jgi:hypothetical protein
MKKMNMYEAPVAEMIEIEAISSMMTTSDSSGNNGTGFGPGPGIPS